MAFASGGMDIEEVAAKNPELILKRTHPARPRAAAVPGAQAGFGIGIARSHQ